MATSQAKKGNLLYLDQIILQDVPKLKYSLSLFAGNQKRELEMENNRTWALAQRLDISPTSQLRVEIEISSAHLPWAKKARASQVIDLQELFNGYWTNTAHNLAVQEGIDVGKHSFSLELQFSAEPTAESLRLSLHKLEELLNGYSPLMNESTERVLEKAIKYGAAFAELNGIAKAAFSVAKVTFELIKEQNNYDQMPIGISDRLQRILSFADKVADEIVGEETSVLEKTIPRMFKVMETVSKFSCTYVKRGRFERTLSGLVDPGKIEEMGEELTKVIEDFDRAVNVEALRTAKETERELLLKRLESVKASYDLDGGCMEGTRQSILNDVMAWVASTQEENEATQKNTYWFYGSPGIGKTSLAHSICAKLHNQKNLAGAFFCRRDDPDLNNPRNILPTFITKLAGIFPPFRRIVAERLRNDPNLTPQSMNPIVFLDFIHNLPRRPKRTLVFVIDALDECGDDKSRPSLLRVLTDAAAQAEWLRIIITSRPEADIQRFFDTPNTKKSHVRYDLAADDEASSDLRAFAQDQFSWVAFKQNLKTPWPEQSLFDGVVSRAAGLFIFVKTISLALEHCRDPTVVLKATLEDSAGPGLTSLYGLYSSILRARIVHSGDEFRRVVGVLLATAPYRLLREETIATLAGVEPRIVERWVDDLSSLLYRVEGANGGIRVRHLSISDFFINDHCDYRVNLQDAHAQLGISCLETMVKHLRFNICKLDDSRVANADIEDLQSRIVQNISGALQYSSLYWSNHFCVTPHNANRDRSMLASLNEFFEGLYPLLWTEVLSIMGMVPIAAPSLRRAIFWIKDADSTLIARIHDFCRFIITFHHPISISAPHTYISTYPFLPSQSPLSTVFSMWFAKTRAIAMRSRKLLSWPAPPLEWIGHTDAVLCISWSPNGSHIVSGSSDHTIRIWDAETGTVVGEALQGHNAGVLSVAYSPDGHHIVSASADRTIRIWDAETGIAVGKPLEGHNGGVFSVAYSPDGHHIISASADRTIRIWDAETGAAVGKPLEGHNAEVLSVAYSPDGRHIVSASADNTIRIWDFETGAAAGKPLEGHSRWVQSVTYSPNGCHIVSASDDATIRIWDAETGTAVSEPLASRFGVYVLSVNCSPDGRHIVSASADNIIRIWDAETGALVGAPLMGHTDWVRSAAYSPDGRHIVSASDDKTIRMWDAETGAAVGNPIEGFNSRVVSVNCSPDGRHIVSAAAYGTIRIWDAETGAAVGAPLVGHDDCVRSVTYSPDGRHIASASDDTTIRIWDVKAGARVGKLRVGHSRGVTSIAYSPNGRRIISGSDDNTILIWDAHTSAAVGRPLRGHTGSVCSVAFSPDQRHIISGSDDATIRIWDAETGGAVGKPLEGHDRGVSSVAYSPDGHHITSGGDDKTIRIWDAETGVAVGMPLEGHTARVRRVAYSPNGRHIVSGSNDGTIRIWDAKTGTLVGEPFKGHTDSVTVAYSPNGRYIISGSYDNTIRVWDSFPRVSDAPSSYHNQTHSNFRAAPDADGWIRDPEGGLLYWVPPDCRRGLHSPGLLTIPPTSQIRSVSLDFESFAFGTSWTQIFNNSQS